MSLKEKDKRNLTKKVFQKMKEEGMPEMSEPDGKKKKKKKKEEEDEYDDDFEIEDPVPIS